MSDCVFCEIGSSTGENHTYDIVPQDHLASLVIAESPNFLVLLDIAPIVENHCLLVPRQHVPAFAYLTDYRWNEVQMLLGRVTETLFRLHGFRPSLFEHGIHWREALPSCCIDHAHIHVVPIDLDLTPIVEKDSYSLVQVGDDQEAYQAVRGTSYLYYNASTKNGRFYDASRIPSQYLRRIYTESLGQPIWNWQDCLHLSDPALVTARLVRSHRIMTENLASDQTVSETSAVGSASSRWENGGFNPATAAASQDLT
jgi:diadenosine tetraphosphate (Ap4A) HIT family hydrolase